MSWTPFPDVTLDTAPAASRRSLEGVVRHLGYLPAPAARLAGSPQLLDGFLKLTGLFDSTTLAPLAREVVILTVATRNACHTCVAMHTAVLGRLGADESLATALRARQPLPDPALEALRRFVLAVLEHAGQVGDDELRAFLDHGYTTQNALEVVLGIGTYTLSTFANRLTGAPLDPQLAPYAWHEPQSA
ncbi:carboxymuconolactone decarboxylase family protein [Kitasatospora nipponensis]|uniref:Carboxymuconolactone decarboxylase family protein n=1 Tax=Kitasatospora nipponensis TaxID=258049 RepID=A0ABN1WWH0_9ACTN